MLQRFLQTIAFYSPGGTAFCVCLHDQLSSRHCIFTGFKYI